MKKYFSLKKLMNAIYALIIKMKVLNVIDAHFYVFQNDLIILFTDKIMSYLQILKILSSFGITNIK